MSDSLHLPPLLSLLLPYLVVSEDSFKGLAGCLACEFGGSGNLVWLSAAVGLTSLIVDVDKNTYLDCESLYNHALLSTYLGHWQNKHLGS